jgi:hypothetical protein
MIREMLAHFPDGWFVASLGSRGLIRKMLAHFPDGWFVPSLRSVDGR